MRFISVYGQSKRVEARGFSTQQQAIDFLGWGYEDNDLIPYGIYDAVLAEGTVYQHPNEPHSPTTVTFIEQAAQDFIRLSNQRTNGRK